MTPLLSHPNEAIAREALALMKALLFFGNETVQDGVVQSIQDTREEKLFISLKRKLEIASIQFKETYANYVHLFYGWSINLPLFISSKLLYAIR